MKLTDRSTGDLLILMLATLVVIAVLVSTVGVIVVEIVRPDQDTSAAGAVITGIINTLVGLVAGYLAGRTDREQRRYDK